MTPVNELADTAFAAVFGTRRGGPPPQPLGADWLWTAAPDARALQVAARVDRLTRRCKRGELDDALDALNAGAGHLGEDGLERESPPGQVLRAVLTAVGADLAAGRFTEWDELAGDLGLSGLLSQTAYSRAPTSLTGKVRHAITADAERLLADAALDEASLAALAAAQYETAVIDVFGGLAYRRRDDLARVHACVPPRPRDCHAAVRAWLRAPAAERRVAAVAALHGAN